MWSLGVGDGQGWTAQAWRAAVHGLKFSLQSAAKRPQETRGESGDKGFGGTMGRGH